MDCVISLNRFSLFVNAAPLMGRFFIGKYHSSTAFESGLAGISGMIGVIGKVAGIKFWKPASF